jgi:phosphoglycerate-specific signal transduction histidine kinase
MDNLTTRTADFGAQVSPVTSRQRHLEHVNISLNTRWPGPETIRLEEHAQRALSEQGCQIFLVQHTKTEKYTKLQQNIPKIYPKYTKLPQNLPNCHKIYQITTKYTKWP